VELNLRKKYKATYKNNFLYKGIKMDITTSWILIGSIITFICILVAFLLIYRRFQRYPKKRQFPGEFLGGRYRIFHELGRGMNAVTYRVEDNKNPDIPLAAKVLLPPEEEPRISRSSFNRHIRRFNREIENLKKLKGCKFVVPLYDSQPNNIQPFFVMKLCDCSLQDELAKTPLPMHMILNVLLDVCEGLQEIHDHEVFHRDFKPANILKYEGRWVLADFGMSLMGGDGGLVTVPDSFPGTIPYTPPEVMYNEPDTIGPAADIFSLGVTLKAMFTGNTILKAKASDLLPGRINIKTKRQIKLFDKFIEKMTNMESKNRPQSIGDVAKKIEEIFEEVNKIEGKKKKILFSKPHRERLKFIIRKEQRKIISVNKLKKELQEKETEIKKVKTITESAILSILRSQGFKVKTNLNHIISVKKVEIPRREKETLAFNLKRLRQFKGLTKEVLAKKVGLTKDTISKIELGKQENIGFKYLISICRELDIAIEELFIKNWGLEKISNESEPNEEMLLVLKTLAGNASRYAERGGLNVVYDRAFEEKTQADFNIILGMLHASGQIKTSKPPDSDERIHITDNGLLYYYRHRKRLKKK